MYVYVLHKKMFVFMVGLCNTTRFPLTVLAKAIMIKESLKSKKEIQE